MQVFLIMNRTDIPDGELQVVDLWPNTSSKNYIYPPGLGQTGYIHNIPAPLMAGSVDTGPPVVAMADLYGVGAYMLGNIDDGGATITAADADAIAAGLLAITQADPGGGTALNLAAVNAVIGGVVGGASLTAGGSTGVLTELLSILAGNVYLVSSGTALSDGGGAFIGPVGDFVEGTYKQLYDIGQFKCSHLNGNVSLLKDPNFTYLDVEQQAVTVYAEDGTLYV
jgi:hypothetical protein